MISISILNYIILNIYEIWILTQDWILLGVIDLALYQCHLVILWRKPNC
jgi:hypothetical protein